MIDTQRLGAFLRALIRDDAQSARLRTPAAVAVRPASSIGPELAPPDPQLARVPPQASGRAPPSAALQLSDTGRLLLSALRADAAPINGDTVPRSAMQPLLPAHENVDDTPAQPAAARARPLVAVPPHSEYATDRLALQLKDAVEFSGVFYESHLAQWADDLRPRALLAREPQARWPASADLAQAQAPGAGASAPADYATPLLRQQLEVLDTGRFVWAGELWPGQKGALIIEEEEQPAHRPGDAPARSARWRIRITLTFPRLGPIDAALTLAGDTVELGLRCDTPDVAQRLRTATPALRTAIAERALDLTHVSIADDCAA